MTSVVIGPFAQILTMEGLPTHGPLHDDQLKIIKNGGIWVENGKIRKVGRYNSLKNKGKATIELDFLAVAVPGYIDAHTHLCWAGSRCSDYAKRLKGATYQTIAAEGGGILSTVKHTQKASQKELVKGLLERCAFLKSQGITTCEVKSGYGLTVETEIKILKAIRQADQTQSVKLISTCLAAHMRPKEFSNNADYLNHLVEELFPKLKHLTRRIDIFVEEGFFTPNEAYAYLSKAKALGFQLVVHANQFTKGGAALAAKLQALSADHLEVTSHAEWRLLRKNGVIPIVLPGCSLGMGLPFAHARTILDEGLPLVIASDWNPGTAPMGQLLTQAAILGASQHLTMAETFAAITTRAALALQLTDSGQLSTGFHADIAIYACQDYREILYYQGSLRPVKVFTSREFGDAHA